MKKVLLILATFIATLTAGVVLAACDGDGGHHNPNDREGEKCYIDVVKEVEGPFSYKGVTIRYGTDYNGLDNWFGVEDVPNGDGTFGQQKHYFIKGDVVNFKVYCNSQFYYSDRDLKLVINGEQIAMTTVHGIFDDPSMPQVDYLTCSYTIQENIFVDYANLKEKSANITLNAFTKKQLIGDIDPDASESEIDYLLNINYIMDNSVKVRFEDKDTFGLDKAVWGLNELREYLASNPVTGKVGGGSGTNVYVYSTGYTIECPQLFEDILGSESDGRTFIERYAYINELDNEYGYRINLRAIDFKDDALGNPGGPSIDCFKDSKVRLDTKRIDKLYRRNNMFGKYDKQLVNNSSDYRLVNILEVNGDNPIFSIKYGNGKYNEYFDFADFNSSGKINAQIKLNKYSDQTEPKWKTLYDKMELRISDVVLKKGVDYTISSTGIINLTLDRPYEYFKVDAHEGMTSDEIPMTFMYDYNIYFDIIDMARDAGLLTEIDVTRDENNKYLKIYLGNNEYYATDSFDLEKKLIATVLVDEPNYQYSKRLVVKGDTIIYNVFGEQYDFSKMKITAGNNSYFDVDVETFIVTEEISYEALIDKIEKTEFKNGKNAIVLKVVDSYTDEHGIEHNSYQYYIKVLTDLNVKEIRLHN